MDNVLWHEGYQEGIEFLDLRRSAPEQFNVFVRAFSPQDVRGDML
jgi:hypothetical protein